ncbi:Ger(x)C family spore germination protein [Tepidibacter formicigenes]|jgi:spore germination protein KC|uniref:Spore germination protein KC n=1 Tax=Tepidibacter formicigenes DSM 15518 TaxID=1123349 RepID=A0A1M6KYS4_9FIRM|nr:Ger(x)C family spore germination protein [Tepidibacter formicigenes]SHJ64049.1 spore germination protein KC [Tepidibacter formicigenes DSM 15518]
MKNIKIIILVFTILICLFILTGCWNYREISDVNIINGVAVDKYKEKEKYILSVEIIKPKAGQEFKMDADVISEKGDTLFDAARTMITHSAKRGYWSHAKVFIISEEIAKEGIVNVIDYINRDAEVRADIWLLVSKEKTAKEILEGKTKLHATISAHLEDKLKNEKSTSKFKAVELHQFLNDLSSEGISAVLPVTYMVTKKEDIVPEIYGSAVFKKDKMVGYIDGIETRSMLLIKDELKGGVFVVEDVGEKSTDVSLEIFKAKTKVKPILKDGNIVMRIDSEIDVGIGEIMGDEDLISEKGREKLKKQAELVIEKQMKDVIRKAQKEYESDIFGFGNVVYREMPNEWKKVKCSWSQIFKNLDTQINVKLNIKGSALTSKPIKIGD